MARRVLILSALVAATDSAVHAYIGPGAGFALWTSLTGLISVIGGALLGLFLFPFRAAFRRSSVLGALLVLLVALGIAVIGWNIAAAPDEPDGTRVVILGFDGMDPDLVEKFWAEGGLPNLKRLAGEQGCLRLATTWPPASPVAWSSFMTGLDPETHTIRDFLQLARGGVLSFSIAAVQEPERFFEAGRWRIPLSEPRVSRELKGAAFWESVRGSGRTAVALRVPVTFPPDSEDSVTRMISGMGVPDMRGTQGLFVLHTNRVLGAPAEGGEVRRLLVSRDGSFQSSLTGPAMPFSREKNAAEISFKGHIDQAARTATLSIQGREVTIAEGEWSDFVPVSFPLGLLSYADGLVKFHLVSSGPYLELYQSPINLDPRVPALRISTPLPFAAELARATGLYHTAGMPEETWGLEAGALSERAFLESVRMIALEQRTAYEREFLRLKNGVLTAVFVAPDRVSHMFWRYLDPLHPLHDTTAPEASRRAVRDIYEEMDHIVGWTLDNAGPNTRVVVVSDHGFGSFRFAVNLNSVLAEAGYAVTGGGDAREANRNVSRAVAAGFNGVFLNPPDDATLADSVAGLLLDLRHPGTGRRAIRRVHVSMGGAGPQLVVGYDEGFRASWRTALGEFGDTVFESNRKRWSGDHLVDPELVPGVLMTNLKVAVRDPELKEIGPAVAALLTGAEPPGRVIFAR